MADVTRKTRLAPPLMHVFRAAHAAKDAAKKIDMRTESGERTIAGRRLPARQVITESELRRDVVQDLAALLNTVAMESTVDLSEAEEIRKSILNFGLPDISNCTIDAAGMRELPEQIRRVIVNYEPRLAGASLSVERDMSVNADELRVRFIVRADIAETGKITVNRL
jgi:type VI secretion system protein ImpF